MDYGKIYLFLFNDYEKIISYIRQKRGIGVTLYKQYFLSSHFYSQLNKGVFHPFTFPSSNQTH